RREPAPELAPEDLGALLVARGFARLAGVVEGAGPLDRVEGSVAHDPEPEGQAREEAFLVRGAVFLTPAHLETEVAEQVQGLVLGGSVGPGLELDHVREELR